MSSPSARDSSNDGGNFSGGAKWHSPDSPFLRMMGKVAECSSPKQLLAFCNDLLIGWSEQNRCLCAVDIDNGDKEDRCYELSLSHKVTFSVDRLCPSPTGNLLLWGANGAVVVALPHHDNFRNATGDAPLQCKSWGIGELLLMQTAGLEVLGLQWVPDSASEVVMLTSDNCLRLFDISKKHMNALTTVQVIRRSLSLSRMNFSIASATGSQLVDFAFGRSAQEIFCLSASGSIYHVTGLESTANSKPRVSKRPLVMLPEAEDNFGSDGFALLSLNCNPADSTILILGGTGGVLYHCLVLPTESPDVEPEIYIFEQLRLNLTYSEMTDPNDVIRCPILLQRDPALSNRYFAHHDSGVHVVIIPFTERLFTFAQQGDTDTSTNVLEVRNCINSASPNSLAEQVVCTRTTEASAPDAPLGLCVLPALPSPWLAILTSGLKVVNIPLSRYRFEKSLKNILLTEEPLSESAKSGIPPTDFEREIKMILTGSRVPVLVQADKVTSPKELLELALQTTQRFREQHFAQLIAVKKLIEDTSQSLRETKDLQSGELRQLEQDLNDVTVQNQKLNQKLSACEEQKRKLMLRLHDVIQMVQRKNPSAANPQMVKEVQSLYERMNRLESVLESTKERRKNCEDLEQFERILKQESMSARDAFAALGESQRVALESRLKINGHEIGKMVREVKELLADVE
ncbi:nuclear pore complex protein Nup88-like [Varroa jacobsoni]|uniref:Nuclear pore complex protein Nup88 n=1 Tax=Varroa destructor TaxID=109461 RepID=A0A7M7JJC3_VARDE|nr:nuclear pore complex protein Nup88-like isoform X2 [Varroa destructor]XP_022698410.1 nuclear pore complex protein Nup88-like [Varroa jacobsoni]